MGYEIRYIDREHKSVPALGDYISATIRDRDLKKKIQKKKLKFNFYFEASEYYLMLKLTNFVIWNNFSSFHYAGTKN